MTRVLFFLVLLLGASGLPAQHRSFPLDQGQWLVGLSPGGGGGTSIGSMLDLSYPDGWGENPVIESAWVEAWNAQSGPAWSGDTLSFEYGLSDTWALGLKTSAPGRLVIGSLYNEWSLSAGAWASFDAGRAWFDAPDLGLSWYTLVQLEPLFDNLRNSPDGLINAMSCISTSWRMLDNEVFSLAVYSDWGYMVSVPNPYLAYSWNSKRAIRRTISSVGNVFAPGAKIELRPFTSKFVVMVGAEMRLFERWSLVLGWDAPLLLIDSLWATPSPFESLEAWMLGAIELKYRL